MSLEIRLFDRATAPHTITLVSSATVAAVASNLFLPSLPGMARYFEADYSVVQLTVSIYLAAQAILQLAIGPASDRFGRRPIMLLSFIIFTISTFAATWSPTIEFLLLCRVFQAFSVAGMVLSRAIVRDMYGTAESASRIGYIVTATMLAPMIGPMFGGFLDEIYGWKSTFYLTAAFGIIALSFVYFDLGETNSSKSSSFRAQVKAYPELLKSRLFWGFTATSALSTGSFFAFIGGAPYISTEILGLSPSMYGIYFGGTSLGYAIGNFISGRYSRRWGIEHMMLVGNIISVISMFMGLGLFMFGYIHPMSLFLPVGILSLGSGLIQPNAAAGIVSVKPHLAGSASGLGGAFQIGTGALLSFITGLMLSPDTGAYPLLILMTLSSLGALVSTLYVSKISYGSSTPR